jgi:calcineurin-like phosphoesterase family protein
MKTNSGGKIYIWSDLHLGHGNIIRYGNRPFSDMAEMNEALLYAWEVTVKPGDTIINLGDITLKFIKERLTETIHKMPGHKILVMGNHDRRKHVRWWMDVGFDEVNSSFLSVWELNNRSIENFCSRQIKRNPGPEKTCPDYKRCGEPYHHGKMPCYKNRSLIIRLI